MKWLPVIILCFTCCCLQAQRIQGIGPLTHADAYLEFFNRQHGDSIIHKAPDLHVSIRPIMTCWIAMRCSGGLMVANWDRLPPLQHTFFIIPCSSNDLSYKGAAGKQQGFYVDETGLQQAP